MPEKHEAQSFDPRLTDNVLTGKPLYGLSRKQQRRVELLRIAREVLIGDQPTLSVGIVQAQAAAKVDPFDLIAVAEYLELGTQPRPLRMVDDEEFTNALLDAQTWEQP